MYNKEKIYYDTVEIVKNAVTSSANDEVRNSIGTFIKEVYTALKEINEDIDKRPY